MPSELRVLRFDLDEAGTALRALGPRIGLEVPDGVFASAMAGSNDEANKICFIFNAGMESFVVSNGHLAASLIHYCSEYDVPLPRAGTKKIFVAQKFIELRIVLGNLMQTAGAESKVEI